LIFLDAYFEFGRDFRLDPCWSTVSDSGPIVKTGATDRRVRKRRCWLDRMFRSWSVIPAPFWVSGLNQVVKKEKYRHEGN